MKILDTTLADSSIINDQRQQHADHPDGQRPKVDQKCVAGRTVVVFYAVERCDDKRTLASHTNLTHTFAVENALGYKILMRSVKDSDGKPGDVKVIDTTN